MKDKIPLIIVILICLCIIGIACYTESQEPKTRIRAEEDVAPTETPTPILSMDLEKEPKGELYYNQAGEIFTSENIIDGEVGKIKIDRIAFYFDEWLGGTYSLHMSLEGQLVSGNADFYLKYKLYDENEFVVDDGTFEIDNLEEGDKFKNEELTIRDLEKIGTYTLKIMSYE